jgi:diguanylate cyclase (GGDEF)-like protein/PAS domain S-box-containing protein
MTSKALPYNASGPDSPLRAALQKVAALIPRARSSIEEIARHAATLFGNRECARVTLDSIGDAVVSTNARGRVTYLNAAAERMTGWPLGEAEGHPVEHLFRIVDAVTRETIQSPMAAAMRMNGRVSIGQNCVLIGRHGVEIAIADSAAPIHDRRGTVTGAVMVFHDVSAVRALSLRMSHLAQHDNLTNLPNRVFLSDRLAQALALADRHGHRLALLYLDIDSFKNTNDSLGHDVGDRLLQSVAGRLLSCVRTSDTVSRQGGDEFVILLSHVTHPQDAAVCAEKVLDALRAAHQIGLHELHLTASIGIVTYPDDAADGECLLKHADIAMYHAKSTGRDRYRLFEPEMGHRAVERQFLEESLRHALEREELTVCYQPRINLETGALVGAEALIRWNQPQRGAVLPARFIPIAEESGLIVPIGRWVLREACREASRWHRAGIPLRMAVNVSTVQLRSRAFLSDLRAILEETQLPPQLLELELTESFLMQDSRFTVSVLRSLNEVGVRLALDDFGTGYSNLSYLKRFPLDILKIDRSFVSDVAKDARDASIVSAVIAMGRNLNLSVVAEGIETPEQLAFLRAHGCPEGQGEYFGPPLSVAELVDYVRSRTDASCGLGRLTTPMDDRQARRSVITQ